MKVGDLVRYCNHLIRRTKTPVGVIIRKDDATMLVQWNGGTRQWRHSNVLEVISESH